MILYEEPLGRYLVFGYMDPFGLVCLGPSVAKLFEPGFGMGGGIEICIYLDHPMYLCFGPYGLYLVVFRVY